jgi:hypothetical protein
VKRIRTESGGGPRVPTSIVTGMRISASPGDVWEGLMFYEQIPERPPLHLRLLLPEPLRVEGLRSAVGDEARCVYDRGHLLKRVTGIDPGRRYEFAVVEQSLVIGRGIRLTGGSYTLLALAGGSTRIELETRYVGSVRPRRLWTPLEAAVCHAFHRHILGAMRRAAESRLLLPRRHAPGPA